MSSDAIRIATYEVGDPAASPVLAVHGFGSSAQVNWFATGWVRELLRGDHRVIAVDLRGHGLSDKPLTARAYSMRQLVDDVDSVLEAYLLDEVDFVGYSLGARVGWHASSTTGRRIARAVLGGIPDGRPLRRFRVDLARGHLRTGQPVEDPLTAAYLELASRSPGNELEALVALVEGVQGGLQPDPKVPPQQPVLFATGTADPILADSERLARAAPRGEFFAIPDRNHFNAPTSRAFRSAALGFLARRRAGAARTAGFGPGGSISMWDAGIAALRLHHRQAVVTAAALNDELTARWHEWEACVAATAPTATPPGTTHARRFTSPTDSRHLQEGP